MSGTGGKHGTITEFRQGTQGALGSVKTAGRGDQKECSPGDPQAAR